MSETVAIIPARYGAKRFPGKALADLNGKPLIRHVYERVTQASLVSRVAVATDDDRIADAVRLFGGEVIMTSPDHASGTDRIVEASKKTGGDIIVNVQGDEPLIEPGVIDRVIQKIEADPDIVCSTAAFPVTDASVFQNPNAVKVVFDQAGRALYFSRSPIPFNRDETFERAYIHVGIYCLRKSFLDIYPTLRQSMLEQTERLEQLRILDNGYYIGVVEITGGSPGVDTPEDLAAVRRFMAQ